MFQIISIRNEHERFSDASSGFRTTSARTLAPEWNLVLMCRSA